jgi:hypothetical protein
LALWSQESTPFDQLQNLNCRVWADELARKYRARRDQPFLLHHNIYDLFRARNGYLLLLDSCRRIALATRDRSLYPREGDHIRFGRHDEAFVRNSVSQTLAQRHFFESASSRSARALPMIERFLYYADRVAVVINFLETIFPAGEIGYLSSEDRNALVALQRWMTNPRLVEADNLVVLIAESIADVHARIRENARLGLVRIPYPDVSERSDYLGEFLKEYPIKQIEMNTQQLAEITSGLNYVHLRSMLLCRTVLR